MAISWIENKSGGAANAGAITLTFTTALTAGDLVLVMHCDGDSTDNVMPAPSAGGTYTDVGTSEQYSNGSTNDSNSKAWYHYATGGETLVTLAGTGGGSNCGSSAACMVFRGVASAAQGGPFSTAVTKATGTTANADPPQIATAAGDWVVSMVAVAQATAGAATAPANYTTNANLGTGGTDTIDGKAAMAYRASGYANPENPAAWAFAGSAAGDAWTAVTAALKEAPPPVLVIADTASASLVDNLALTQHNILAVADTASASLIDNLTLTAHEPGNPLIIQDAADASLIDNVVLTQHNVLAVQDTASASLADNLVLTQHNVLAVQDTASTSTADNIALVQHNVLVVQDATSGSTIDNVVLSIPDEGSDFTSGWRAGSAYFSKS